jgi:hypothetical protein
MHVKRILLHIPQVPLGNPVHEPRHDIASKELVDNIAREVCMPHGHEVLFPKVSDKLLG